MIFREWVWQALPSSRERIASYASELDGLRERRTEANTLSKPAPSRAVVSQCHAVNRSVGALPSSFCWLAKTSSVSLASSSGSLMRPRLSPPSW